MGFASFGLELCISGRYADADRFGRLACALVDRHGFVASRPTAYMITGRRRTRTTATTAPACRCSARPSRRGLAIGDLLFASFCSNFLTLGPYLLGTHLDEVARAGPDLGRVPARSQYGVFVPPVASVLNLARQLARRLGGPAGPSTGPTWTSGCSRSRSNRRTLPIVSFGYTCSSCRPATSTGTSPPRARAAGEGQLAGRHHARSDGRGRGARLLPRWQSPPRRRPPRNSRSGWWRSARTATGWPTRRPTVPRTSSRDTPWSRQSWRGSRATTARRGTTTRRRSRAARDAGLLQYAALASELAARLDLGRGRTHGAAVYLEAGARRLRTLGRRLQGPRLDPRDPENSRARCCRTRKRARCSIGWPSAPAFRIATRTCERQTRCWRSRCRRLLSARAFSIDGAAHGAVRAAGAAPCMPGGDRTRLRRQLPDADPSDRCLVYRLHCAWARSAARQRTRIAARCRAHDGGFHRLFSRGPALPAGGGRRHPTSCGSEPDATRVGAQPRVVDVALSGNGS